MQAISTRPQSIICSSVYLHNDIFRIVVGHGFILVTLLLHIVMIYRFNMKLNVFPVRTRSPMLALLQMIMFMLTLLVVYLTEIFLLLDVNWGSDSTADIPYSRIIFKALYLAFRMSCFPIFLLRYQL